MVRHQSGQPKKDSTQWTKVSSLVSLLSEAAIVSTVFSIFVSVNPTFFNTPFPVRRPTQVKQAPPPYIIALRLPMPLGK